MASIYIPFYSRYGNVEAMAQAVAEGVTAAGGEPTLAFIRDLITPAEVIDQDERWEKTNRRCYDTYAAASIEGLREADGAAFGVPTRFGSAPAQVRMYFDRMTPLWMDGSLVDTPGAVFTSTATMHGGQETTAVSTWFPMIHLGMLIVGVPYTEPRLSSTTTGGTPYGPSHVAGGAGDIPPDETELEICRTLGKRLAVLAEKLK